MLTNARSLSPKIESLIDFVNEMEITVGIITESWFKDGPELEKDLKDIELGTGLKIVYKNRARKKGTARYGNQKTKGGGVALIFNSNKINLTEHKISGNKFELVAAQGRQEKSGRVIYVLAIYIPPKMRASTFTELTECIINEISLIKSKHDDAIICLGGDMNRRDFSQITRAFPDITTSITGPTRAGVLLDLVATNIEQFVQSSNIYPPLESEDGKKVTTLLSYPIIS